MREFHAGDPRLVTARRGGSLQDDDPRLLAVWAADCAQHVLPEESWIHGLFLAVKSGSIDDASEEPLDFR